MNRETERDMIRKMNNSEFDEYHKKYMRKISENRHTFEGDYSLYIFELSTNSRRCPICGKSFFGFIWHHGKRHTCDKCQSEFVSYGNGLLLENIVQEEVAKILQKYATDVKTRNIVDLYWDTDFRPWEFNMINKGKLGLISELLKRSSDSTLSRFLNKGKIK